MGESELHEPRERRKAARKAILKRMTVVNAVFIVAIIALAGISISLFGLASHYHDSKYRAQYELVSIFADSILTARSNIQNMKDDSLPDYDRLGTAVSASIYLGQAEKAAYAIDVMYPRDSKQSAAFVSIETATGQAQHVVYSYESKLDSAIQHNTTYESNSTVNALFTNATGEMTNLVDLVLASWDDARDWQKDPYSLVNRMDLVAIVSAATQLEDTCNQLALLMP